MTDQASRVYGQEAYGGGVQHVSVASPEFDALTGLVTVTGYAVYLIAPIAVSGLISYASNGEGQPYRDGEWLELIPFVKSSTVDVTPDAGETVGFEVDGGTSLTATSVDGPTDAAALAADFNADPGYSAEGVATPTGSSIAIVWTDDYSPAARKVTDLSTGAAQVDGELDKVEILNDAAAAPHEASGFQTPASALVELTSATRVRYLDASPSGVPLERWVLVT